MIPTKEQAWDLLCAYNEGEFHRLHARRMSRPRFILQFAFRIIEQR